MVDPLGIARFWTRVLVFQFLVKLQLLLKLKNTLFALVETFGKLAAQF